jgi:hypothetical protein
MARLLNSKESPQHFQSFVLLEGVDLPMRGLVIYGWALAESRYQVVHLVLPLIQK